MLASMAGGEPQRWTANLYFMDSNNYIAPSANHYNCKKSCLGGGGGGALPYGMQKEGGGYPTPYEVILLASCSPFVKFMVINSIDNR